MIIPDINLLLHAYNKGATHHRAARRWCEGLLGGDQPVGIPWVVILGEEALAGEIARRFCETVRRGGPAENFDAVTGAPLCDPSYTWTSSVFLVLAYEYLTR